MLKTLKFALQFSLCPPCPAAGLEQGRALRALLCVAAVAGGAVPALPRAVTNTERARPGARLRLAALSCINRDTELCFGSFCHGEVGHQ